MKKGPQNPESRKVEKEVLKFGFLIFGLINVHFVARANILSHHEYQSS